MNRRCSYFDINVKGLRTPVFISQELNLDSFPKPSSLNSEKIVCTRFPSPSKFNIGIANTYFQFSIFFTLSVQLLSAENDRVCKDARHFSVIQHKKKPFQ